MSTKRSSNYVDVDELVRGLSVEQVTSHFGVDLSAAKRIGNEIRTRCFLVCQHTGESGDRSLAIETASGAMKWKCHHYPCQREGNAVKLVDNLLHGDNGDEKPTGERFKAVLAELQKIASGDGPAQQQERLAVLATTDKPAVPVNVPLAEHENERVRAIANLGERLISDVANMSPTAAAYFRQRPYLTAEVARRWGVGYLPRDGGSLLRGKIVFTMHDRAGRVVAYAGRDPEWEEKHNRWIRGGREGAEPAKWRYPASYHRGVELYGQHRLDPHRQRRLLDEIGLLVAEGPGDVINLMETFRVPTVGLCSNHATDRQIELIIERAKELAARQVVLMLDCDPEGDKGAAELASELAKHLRVRRPWALDLHNAVFAGRQPESLTLAEGQRLRSFLLQGN
jgi:5S rRNA maturation endonuclease (ribonuclease M5)